MSLYRWFAPTKQTAKLYLPDPSKEGSQKDASEVEAANQCVEKEMEKMGRKRRGTYNYYDPELCAKIGKYAATLGNVAAVSSASSWRNQSAKTPSVASSSMFLSQLAALENYSH